MDGKPLNIASYAQLTHRVAEVPGLEPGELVRTFDAHLYLNHVGQARLQLAREPLPFPSVTLAPKSDLFALEYEDVSHEGCQAWPHIKAEAAA